MLRRQKLEYYLRCTEILILYFAKNKPANHAATHTYRPSTIEDRCSKERNWTNLCKYTRADQPFCKSHLIICNLCVCECKWWMSPLDGMCKWMYHFDDGRTQLKCVQSQCGCVFVCVCEYLGCEQVWAFRFVPLFGRVHCTVQIEWRFHMSKSIGMSQRDGCFVLRIQYWWYPIFKSYVYNCNINLWKLVLLLTWINDSVDNILALLHIVYAEADM